MRRKAEDPISTIEMLDPTRFFLRTRMSSRGIPVNELKDEAEANGFDWALILERLKDPERYLWHTHRDGTVTVATRTDAPPPPPQERYLDEQERMAAQKWSDIRRSRVRA